jgi:hypothetical protein
MSLLAREGAGKASARRVFDDWPLFRNRSKHRQGGQPIRHLSRIAKWTFDPTFDPAVFVEATALKQDQRNTLQALEGPSDR